eukprot:TRINITY_DN99568_c0_g1_i1.p1 TRINITY_DN99568_c0_g1~~TRINITY_DN99568_c0_g1_i1.p1  ORF type:complete len:262 (-),score=38.94 TRINITY_DN99568_c0_g1_i1:14-799(-)
MAIACCAARCTSCKARVKEFAKKYLPDPDDYEPLAKTFAACTACSCCVWLIFLISFSSVLNATLEGINERWPQVECTVLAPGRMTTLATLCEEFDGTTCIRYAEHKNVLSSVFVRYCRDEADGGLCFDVQADKCAFDSPIDLEQDLRYNTLLTNATSGTIPCWYYKEQVKTLEATDEEVTTSSCSAAASENCTFFKTSKVRYALRLDAEPCVPRPPKGSVEASIALGVLTLLLCICLGYLCVRTRRELEGESSDEEFGDVR